MTTHNVMPNNKIHEGRNVRRFREMRSMKQDALAAQLGDDWNQQKVSLLEQKETIDPVLLQQIAGALNLPVEAFQNFDEEQAITVISSTFNDQAAIISNYPTFHPIDKIIELHDEKIALYERMLKEKEEMIGRLEQLMVGK